MGISEVKKKIVIDNYFKEECDINTSIKEAFTKGFELGLKKAPMSQPKTGHWVYKIYGGFHEQGDWYCSHCDYQYNYGNGHAKFCPECGLKMSEPPTEEVIGDRDYDWIIKR